MTLLVALLALPVPRGWTASDVEILETRAQIYAAIDGAADLYFAYGLQQIQTREYERGELGVEVEVYELGEPLDAFGVLQRERPQRATAVAIGAEGAFTAQLCITRRGHHYVKAKAFHGELSGATCRELLEPIVAKLESAGDPAELALLPKAGRTSIGYTRERYLGLTALVRCLHADYQDETRVFVMMDGDWDRLNKGWQAVPKQPVPVVRREIPYTGWVALAKTGRGLIGAVAASETAVLERLRAVLPK